MSVEAFQFPFALNEVFLIPLYRSHFSSQCIIYLRSTKLKNRNYIQTITDAMDPSSRFSWRRISALMGNRYVSFLVSNQIAVFHSLLPILATALSRPHPSSCVFSNPLIS